VRLGTWEDIKRTVDSIFVEDRATATATVNDFRNASGGLGPGGCLHSKGEHG
jgi:hypothetical protein